MHRDHEKIETVLLCDVRRTATMQRSSSSHKAHVSASANGKRRKVQVSSREAWRDQLIRYDDDGFADYDDARVVAKITHDRVCSSHCEECGNTVVRGSRICDECRDFWEYEYLSRQFRESNGPDFCVTRRRYYVIAALQRRGEDVRRWFHEYYNSAR